MSGFQSKPEPNPLELVEFACVFLERQRKLNEALRAIRLYAILGLHWCKIELKMKMFNS
jgi:hypothetical protein